MAAFAANLRITVDGDTVILTDVSLDAWYATPVKTVADAGIMQGYRDGYGKPNGIFGPSNQVTRAEFLKMVAVMMTERYEFDRSAVQAGARWYEPYLKVVQDTDPEVWNIMPLTEPTLRQPILRHEAAGLLHLGLGNYNMNPPQDPKPFPDVPTDTKNFKAITELHVKGVMTGDEFTGKFEPNRGLNRAEAAKMLVTAAGAYQVQLGE